MRTPAGIVARQPVGAHPRHGTLADRGSVRLWGHHFPPITWDDVGVFYWVVKAILWPILALVFRPWAEGTENVPREGPAILASNHLSFSDHFFAPLPLPRKVTFLAKAEYFTGRGLKGLVSKAFFRGVGQIPVDRAGGRGQRAGAGDRPAGAGRGQPARHLPGGHPDPGRAALPGQDRGGPARAGVRRTGDPDRHGGHVRVHAARQALAAAADPARRPVRQAARFLPLLRPGIGPPGPARGHRRNHVRADGAVGPGVRRRVRTAGQEPAAVRQAARADAAAGRISTSARAGISADDAPVGRIGTAPAPPSGRAGPAPGPRPGSPPRPG